jgi:glycosyltransferase involved in cell wall biosynthesis
MKVLFHYTGYSPSGSGIGGYMKQMGRALRGQGHESFVVTSRGVNLPEEEETDAGVVYRIYDSNDAGKETVADKVLAVATRHGVDLIEGADHLGECAPIIRRKKRPPVLIKYHNCDAISIVKKAGVYYGWQKWLIAAALLRKRRQMAFEKDCIQMADIACSPSQKLIDEIRLQGLTMPRHLAVIPNPIMPVSRGLVPETGVPRILFVGSIDLRKGIEFLPDIIASVCSRFPEALLEIAGNDSFARGLGSMRAWLSSRLGDSIAHVRFLGNLDEWDLDAAYRRAWVVVAPSRWDNFPGSVLEAMIRGKAIVSSHNGGMPEMLEGTSCVIEDPSKGIFVDRVIAFLSDSRSRNLAGESARQKALKDYSPETIVRRYEAFVREALR